MLVDGHRRHRSAFVDVTYQGAQPVDLSQIPLPAIGRIEVLRDGASAQYGSDAIAGVINIVLDDKPGTALSAQAGQYYAGDGFNVILSGRTGLALPGGGRLALSGDYNKSNATDRSIGIRNKLGQPDLQSYHFTYDLKLDALITEHETIGGINERVRSMLDHQRWFDAIGLALDGIGDIDGRQLT